MNNDDNLKEVLAGPEFRDFDRDLAQYLKRLFPDDPQKKEEQKTGVPFIPLPDVDFYSMNKDGRTSYNTYRPEQLGPVFGGKGEFFKKDSVVLDIGSGGGIAVREMSENFAGVKVVGLDIQYGRDGVYSPTERTSSATYIAGEWGKMPFADGAFDRLLSYESFPRYAFSRTDFSVEEVRNIFREITRVVKEGAIWRGTLGTRTINDKPSVINMMLENGWEIYVFPGKTFIARLVKKG